VFSIKFKSCVNFGTPLEDKPVYYYYLHLAYVVRRTLNNTFKS